MLSISAATIGSTCGALPEGAISARVDIARLRWPFLDAAQRPVAVTRVYTHLDTSRFRSHSGSPFFFFSLSSFVADVQNDVARRVQAANLGS